jgi:AraC-like DNA-binding protein
MVWPEHVRPFMHEYLLGVMRAMRGRCVGTARVVRQFLFSYPAPPHHAAYADFLDAPVQFDAEFSGCVFDRETLDLKPPNADRALAGLLERCADGLLTKIEVPETTSAQVRRLVSECLSDGEPSAQHVAQRLGTTASTLRRRLAAEGSSYRALIREVRLERTRAYLANASLSMTEIAYRVGFADTSAFFKAFKLMTGVTPSEYRAQLLQPTGTV